MGNNPPYQRRYQEKNHQVRSLERRVVRRRLSKRPLNYEVAISPSASRPYKATTPPQLSQTRSNLYGAADDQEMEPTSRRPLGFEGETAAILTTQIVSSHLRSEVAASWGALAGRRYRDSPNVYAPYRPDTVDLLL